ncbi:site-specific integrase, partial [Bacillus cereus]|nr:site-specific integrase [Bacillus cereus]MBJ8038156.1 site-specific integrase [Bacillus cereus]
ISSHTLQKTWGYYAYKSGIDIALLQHFFGHSSPVTTLKYIGLTQNNS